MAQLQLWPTGVIVVNLRSTISWPGQGLQYDITFDLEPDRSTPETVDSGFADLYMHRMAARGFGGLWYWPRYDDIAYQQAHVSWLKDAHEEGLMLAVGSMVNFRPACFVLKAICLEDRGTGRCRDMASVQDQIDGDLGDWEIAEKHELLIRRGLERRRETQATWDPRDSLPWERPIGRLWERTAESKCERQPTGGRRKRNRRPFCCRTRG